MNNFALLTCPSCGGRTRLDPGSKTFTCEYCGNQYLLPKQNLETSPLAKRPLVPRPGSISLEKFSQGIRLTRRWFSPTYIGLAIFCVFWDGFLLFWYGIAFSTHAPIIMVLFPVLHLAVGIGLSYSTLAGFINKTEIAVTRQDLLIQHGPLPWTGNMTLPIAGIEQLYCRRIASHSHDHADTYCLCAIDQYGKRYDLIKNLESPEIGFYLEQQIETWLKIEDIAVDGEVTRL